MSEDKTEEIALAERQAILSSSAKVRVVLGAPGVGKTYFGCQLAGHEMRSRVIVRRPGQRVLFLTYARNAVARIREAYAKQAEQGVPNPVSVTAIIAAGDALQHVRIDTFGAFCWWLVTGYARYVPNRGKEQPWLLVGQQPVGGEYVPVGHTGYTFRQMYEEAGSVLGNPAVRSLVSDLYPLVIVDEHQDVDPLLHEIVKLLCEASHGVLLRGPGQSVYGSMMQFDPQQIYEKTLNDLSPEVFTLHALGKGKTRHSPELSALLADYESNQPLYSSPQAELRAIPRLTKGGNPNSLETHAGLAVQALKKELASLATIKPTIGVLTSTNSAATFVYRRLVTGSDAYKLFPMRAALLTNEEMLLQYGRLAMLLLHDHWIARKRGVTHIDLVTAALRGLVACTGSAPGTHEKYVGLATFIADEVRHYRPPKPGQRAIDKLSNDLVHLGEVLRAPKSKLPSGMPSTPFDKRQKGLTDLFAGQLLRTVEARIGSDGRLDIMEAHIFFERFVRQRVVLEKEGLGSQVQVMTIHKAKGREFEGTVLVLEDDARALWRASSGIPERERQDLYRVALSRARSRVVVIAFEDAGEQIAGVLSRLVDR
jgi:DNA helicase-2/ATP-dependent DNA helicase PcrA